MPIGKSETNSLGNYGGNETITLTAEQLPSHSHTGTTDNVGLHSHTATDSGHNHSYTDAYFAENRGSGQNVYGTSAGTDGDNDYIYIEHPPLQHLLGMQILLSQIMVHIAIHLQRLLRVQAHQSI
jgi:hypothetical protein